MRLGVYSNERLNPWINWTTLGPPLLKPLAMQPQARLIAPPPVSWHYARDWKDTLKVVRSVDTHFWMQGASRPEFPIHLASLLGGRARRSAFVIDAWGYLIKKIGTLAVLQQLDPCFVAFREGYEALCAQFPKGRFEWLPFGVDTDVFKPVSGERPVFAYWMGRRDETLHQAMLEYCRKRDLEYRYTMRAGEFTPAELGALVGSSRYFVVAPPDLATPTRTGGFSPFVMRYLEGLSAGARLVGVLPRSGEYQRLLPLDAMLAVSPDGSDLAAKLDADRDNPMNLAAVERASLAVRADHSWARRAEQIFHRLDSGQRTGFED